MITRTIDPIGEAVNDQHSRTQAGRILRRIDDVSCTPCAQHRILLLGEDSHDQQGEREAAAAPWQIGSDAGVGRAAERG
jgi:hypothetical protein